MPQSIPALFSAAILATSLAGPATYAQSAPTAQAPMQTQAVQPSDSQLQKFASASQKIAMVADEYRPKLHSAKDEASRQQIYKEADEKMVHVVQADGLTVDEFNGINQAVEQNPQLKQRVIDMANQQAKPAR